jgi:hypothetical protein
MRKNYERREGEGEQQQYRSDGRRATGDTTGRGPREKG